MNYALNDIIVSLIALAGIRFFAFLIFLEMTLRERKARYILLTAGWFFYCIGPCTGVVHNIISGTTYHPLMGFFVTVGTFLIFWGIILYFYKLSPAKVIIPAITFSVLLIILFFFVPGIAGGFTVSIQLALILVTSVIVLTKRTFIFSTGGVTSYLWIIAFLVLSLTSSIFHYAYTNIPSSVSFLMTLLTNIFLLMMFLHYDRERSIRDIKKNERQIRQSLTEKEILLKEIHHRVKNNMAIMSSLLHLQYTDTKNPAVIEEVQKTQNRIKAMALVHERLYETGDLSQINIRHYIKKLTAYISGTLGHDIEFSLDLADITATPDILIPCGLILNEIISNAYKHAFEKSEEKRIYITVTLNDEKEIVMNIRDNGKGLPDNYNPYEKSGLGFKLISGLTMQMKAKMEIERGKGMSFCFYIPRGQ